VDLPGKTVGLFAPKVDLFSQIGDSSEPIEPAVQLLYRNTVQMARKNAANPTDKQLN